MKRVLKIMMCTSILLMSSNVVYATQNTFSNLNDVEKNIYEHLKNRDTSFSFSYLGDKTEFKNNITLAISNAIKKDDYTERSWLEIKPKAELALNNFETNVTVSYLTTKEQENYVDTEIKKVISEIIKPSMTDLEKVKTIHDYLVNRYDYDYSYKSNNAYKALTTGKTICQGYSMTAYKMLTAAGIQNRIIVGKVGTLSHSWNYVLVNNKWYHLDVTNDDSTRSNKYFLVDNYTMESNNYIWEKGNYPQSSVK